MGVFTYVLKVGAKSLAKNKGTSEYWDVVHTVKQSPALVAKAAHGVHKAYTKVRDAPMPYTKEHAQRQISKLAADDRVPKMDPAVSAKQAARELVNSHSFKVDVSGKGKAVGKKVTEITIGPDEHVSNSYLEYLLQHVSSKQSIQMIRSYVQSHAADNLTPYERTEIIIKCAERLKYIDIIHQFF